MAYGTMWNACREKIRPTAQTSLAATATRALRSANWSGGVTMLHVLPFQRRISASSTAYGSASEDPTAHRSFADVPSTAARLLFVSGRLGVGTWVQADPFHRTARVFAPVFPTAHACVPDSALTPPKNPLGAAT